MKKTFLLLFILLSAYAYGFADIQTFRQEVMQSQAFKGQVESIILPDPVLGINHEIVVTNDKGNKMKFFLISGIGVYGPDWEVLNIKKIKLGDTVLVEYTTNKKGNVNRAISVTITANSEK